MIRDAIGQLTEGLDIDKRTARAVMQEMMSGVATQSQIGAFITAMRMKGETKDELAGFATAMREDAAHVKAPTGAVDLCGTGGDNSGTFNISTLASFVVAAAGVPVAKHGNRSISSRVGSADLLWALGIPYDLEPVHVQRCLDSLSVGFMYAPIFHKSMKNVAAARKEVGIRTFFNILGPLTNPANVRNQLIGVFDERLSTLMAEVLREMETERALIVHGEGLDEITNTGETHLVELDGGSIRSHRITPEEFGFERTDRSSIMGGDASENARIAISVLRGDKSSRSQVVAMNAGAALYLAGKADSIEAGVGLAAETLLNGDAYRKLKEYAEFVNKIDIERQLDMPVKDLQCRRILPDVLSKRCNEVVCGLKSEVASLGDGNALLEIIDPALLTDPNILSILVLNRIKRLSSNQPDLKSPATNAAMKLSEALSGSTGIGVIGEYKPRSPSSPPLTVPVDPLKALSIYGQSGILGISVLVEPDYFLGSQELFAEIRSHTHLPLLYKDFIVSENQIRSAHSLGADSILLIAKALSIDSLARFSGLAISLGIEPLVELHDEADIEKFHSCPNHDAVTLVGLNSRDLRTLRTDNARRNGLRRLLHSNKLVIAESGLRSPDDVRSLHGFKGALVGSLFMQSEHMAQTVRDIVQTGRAVIR